jgi:CRISPR-associated endonuclease/helicase Cas3
LHGDYLEEQFKSITGFPPAEHQRQCAAALSSGKSVILRAPTGSGKSEAVWIPFLTTRGQKLPMRMIHALPMRALVNQLESRMSEYVQKLNRSPGGEVRTAAMHGKRPESVLFYADAIFATLDQVVTSYACTPLSLSVRQGNIPAGAVAGSFLVFDEVHTFEPALGLQSTLVLAERALKLGIPFVIMSATLPGGFLSRLRERFGRDRIEMVQGQRLPAAERSERDVSLEMRFERLTAEVVLKEARTAKKILVVTNTVRRAMELFEKVRKDWPHEILLAHSRFYDDDRQAKEEKIETLFGKEAVGNRCLMIATQVVEVGLDISCDVLLTEIAPIDTLVQRAGRCARWGGPGQIVAFTDLETKRPYDDRLVDSTVEALEGYRGKPREFTWENEKILVDKVLDPPFEKWAQPDAAGRVLASLAEAAFTGSSNKAEQAVRDTLSVEVSLHDNPKLLGSTVLRLPRCRLHPGVFRQFIRKQNPEAWHIVVDHNPRDDYFPKIDAIPLTTTARLMAAGHYVIHPRYARYDSDFGFRLGVPGEPAAPMQPGQMRGHLESTLEPELWQVHIAKVVKNFERYVLPKERVAFEAVARQLEKTSEELLALGKLVLIFHDLGKLTRAWQEKIQAGLESTLPEGSVLAHRGGGIRGLPPHATVSAWVATNCICRVVGSEWEHTLGLAALGAIAHHHSVRSDAVPKFEMAEGWFDMVSNCTRRLAGIEVRREEFDTTPPKGGGSWGPRPNFLVPEAYTSYVLLSRWLRLADRIATGGSEDTIYVYEEWMSRG